MKTLFAPFPTLVTERLTLRQLRPSDAPEILVQRSDKQILQFIEIDKAQSQEDALKFIQMINELSEKGESITWAICLKGDDKLVGTVCLWKLDTEKQVAELGYSLHPDQWGKGIASEAVGAVVDFGFDKMEAIYLEAGCMVGNAASIKLLQKQGFVKIGREDKYDVLALCRPPVGAVVLETERLRLREVTPTDAPFILELLNTPDWLANIGDRNIHGLDDARRYLIQRMYSAYRKWGFGFYVLERKTDAAKLGMCGLVKRDFLDDIDIGYALLPDFYGQGYAVEAARAVMDFAKQKLALQRLAAITIESNRASQRVLEKLGLRFERKFVAPGDEEELMLWLREF